MVLSLDYALYTYRYSIISAALDYAVCGAVLEVDTASIGLEEGFNEENGSKSEKNIRIDGQKADNAFLSIFNENLGMQTEDYIDCLETAVLTPVDNGMEYEIRIAGVKGNCKNVTSGFVTETASLEGILNNAANHMENMTLSNDAQIFINGNKKTNEFEMRPYYIAFIRNLEIDGLFIKRNADFSSLKGAKIEREG